MNHYPDDDDGDALRRVAADGSDMSRPMEVDFMIDVGTYRGALEIAETATRAGYSTNVVEESNRRWTVYCTRTMVLDYASVIEAQRDLDTLSGPFGGKCDGWGTSGNVNAR